jgi:hypothetical protein
MEVHARRRAKGGCLSLAVLRLAREFTASHVIGKLDLCNLRLRESEP